MRHRQRVGIFVVELDFHMGQQADGLLAQARQHLVEQGESLALVFDQRVLLAIGTQVDRLAHVVEMQQMILPLLVQDLQQDALLGDAHDLGAVIGGLLRHALLDRVLDPLDDLLIGDAFLGGPVLDGKIEPEAAQYLGM